MNIPFFTECLNEQKGKFTWKWCENEKYPRCLLYVSVLKNTKFSMWWTLPFYTSAHGFLFCRFTRTTLCMVDNFTCEQCSYSYYCKHKNLDWMLKTSTLSFIIILFSCRLSTGNRVSCHISQFSCDFSCSFICLFLCLVVSCAFIPDSMKTCRF